LKLPFKICQAKQSKLRFPGDDSFGDATMWEKREESWASFWKRRGGKEGFAKNGDTIVGGASYGSPGLIVFDLND